MRYSGRGIAWALFFVLVGVLVLLSNYGALSFSFKLSRDWPIILIAWGLLKLWDVLAGRTWWGYSGIWKHGRRHEKKSAKETLEDLDKGKIDVEEALQKLKE